MRHWRVSSLEPQTWVLSAGQQHSGLAGHQTAAATMTHRREPVPQPTEHLPPDEKAVGWSIISRPQRRQRGSLKRDETTRRHGAARFQSWCAPCLPVPPTRPRRQRTSLREWRVKLVDRAATGTRPATRHHSIRVSPGSDHGPTVSSFAEMAGCDAVRCVPMQPS